MTLPQLLAQLRALAETWRERAGLCGPEDDAEDAIDTCASELLDLVSRAEAALPVEPAGWQPIATVPRADIEYWFWVRPKREDESYTNSSGDPIVSTHQPYARHCKYKCWSALETADWWQPFCVPAPPSPEME